MSARVVVSPTARADIADIIRDLAAKAGYSVAADYLASFERLFDRLAAQPSSGAPRPHFGAHVRVGLVLPYVIFYRYRPGSDVVGVIRVLHGSRNITRRLLRDVK